MRAYLVAVGDELLTGERQNEHGPYLAAELREYGILSDMMIEVGDQTDNLSWVVKNALKRAQLVVITGGLGPTEDDRTREAVADALGLELDYHEEIVEQIRQRFARQRQEMPQINARQGFILRGAEILENDLGTAPGQWLPLGHGGVLMLPGPRHELQPIFEKALKTRIAPLANFTLYKRVVHCSGIGESDLDSRISPLFMPLQRLVQTTVLASPGLVEVHLTGRSRKDMDEMKRQVDDLHGRIRATLADYVLDDDLASLPAQLVRNLGRLGKTLACAESCTAGGVARRLTEAAGASKVFVGGVIAYDNRIKQSLLGVEATLLAEHGAVSARCAAAMAQGVRTLCRTDFGLAITGIAGPDGGSAGKPVGLVFVHISGHDMEVPFHQVFPGTRDQVRLRAEMAALDLLRRHLA